MKQVEYDRYLDDFGRLASWFLVTGAVGLSLLAALLYCLWG